MIFKGMKFIRSKRAIVLPQDYHTGEFKNYCAFGRTCAKNTPNAIQTPLRWSVRSPYNDPPETTDGQTYYYPVYATEVKSDGHSLTNLMYGADGYMYLAYDGRVYVRRRKQRRLA